jgi:acetylornithine deacetylase/succinyl-diaminopimelate desuccinylase-like protein
VRDALQNFESELSRLVDQTIAVQQIPAPTFAEETRAAYLADRFAALGLADVQRDAMHNVFGRIPGQGRGKPVIVTAHSDTVFSHETDLTVRWEGELVHGPGIGDNSLGVAGLLHLAATMQRLELRPSRDVWLVSNVGEEGLGNLRGMHAVVERFGHAEAYIVVEGGLFGRICHQAIGVRRYRIEVRTPGGHSWGAFGTPSAIHQLGKLISAIDRLSVPESPKTTYNVGVISGGTTINSIASSASLLLDLRSEDPRALEALVTQVEGLVAQVRREPEVAVEMQMIGDRPAGEIPRNSWLVSLAEAALREVGASERIEYTTGSTDANVPLSKGIPGVCIGLAQSANAHRVDEYMDVTDLPAGMSQLLLLVLAAAEYH